MTNKLIKTCSVVGARGYAGLETAKLLLQHPNAKLTDCFATSAFKLSDYLSNPEAGEVQCHLDTEIFSHLTDVVFLATPAEVSLVLAPKIIAAGKKVIDLSGAFRLQSHDYATWYGFTHTDSKSLQQANYGLMPWAGPKASSLIANPGCFATAISLALIPLLKDNVIESNNIVIDAKSGSTGAGKKPSENLLFAELDGECLPYKIGRHQHYPEIVEAVQIFSGKKIDAHFVTSILPVRRGIIAGIYAHVQKNVTIDHVHAAFDRAYANYSLVVHGPAKESANLLSLKKVVGTAKTHISYEVVGNKLYLFSCIDNLLKGAASQAIENFNRISDLPLITGVSQLEVVI